MYYKLYDALYRDHPYQLDVNFLLKTLVDNGIKSNSQIIEVGCGTGNHTQLLARHFQKVYALELDDEMLNVAKSKNRQKNIYFMHTKAQDLKGCDFRGESACAFFNVINYITNNAELLKFFEGISSCLEKNAIFIFDCYQENRFKQARYDEVKLHQDMNLIRYTSSVLCVPLLEVTEKFIDIEKNEIFDYKHKWRVWFHDEIKPLVESCGFKMLSYGDKEYGVNGHSRATQSIYVFKKL